MKTEKRFVALVTGESSGIGQAIAKTLSKAGMIVYGGSRRTGMDKSDIRRLKMNVGDDHSVKSAIRQIEMEAGRLDLLVNSAGISFFGPLADHSMDDARMQFETNFFGVHRVIREALPFLRKSARGMIINISSIAGLMGLPFQGMYCASKFALEGYTESLRMELRDTGIRVCLVEPGDFHTSITRNRHFPSFNSNALPVQAFCKQALDIVEKDESQGPEPQAIGNLVLQIWNKKNIRLRYKTGKFSQQVAAMLRKFLPSGFFERMMMRYYGFRNSSEPESAYSPRPLPFEHG